MTATSSRLGRRIVGLALVAVATLTASACGTMQAGAAAVVGDRRISVADLQAATSDIDTYVKAQDPKNSVSQERVLLFMVLEPDLARTASEAGVGVSDSSVRQELGKYGVTEPSAGAVQAMRGLAALNGLKQGNKQNELNTFVAKVHAEKININPRYGTFDPASLTITPTTPDWFAGSETPAPGAAGDGSGQSPAPGANP